MLLVKFSIAQLPPSHARAVSSPTRRAPPRLALAPQVLSPLLPRGHPLDMHLFISEKRDWRTAAAAEEPVWTASNVPLGEPGPARGETYVYRPSPAVQNNGSVWVHAVFTPTGASPSPKGELLQRASRRVGCMSCWAPLGRKPSWELLARCVQVRMFLRC